MKYYLIVGEASGDLHASRLMRSLKKIDEFAYIGGGQFYTTAHNGGHGLIINTSGSIVRELGQSVRA